MLPPASCAVTTGCVVNALPPVAPVGCVEKTSLVATPGVTSKAALRPLILVSLACSLYALPTLSILQPVKVVTPETSEPEQPLSAAPLVPVPEAIDSETVPVYVVTVLPPASAAATTGWVVNAEPPVAPAGCAVKTSCAAAPTVTLNAEL